MKDQALIRERSVPNSSGCWIWSGDTSNRWKYGRLGPGRKERLAHRISYAAFKGAIPSGVKVLHRCDVPRCVNPEHLFLGTLSDNMRDMASKGRTGGAAGKRLNAKLNIESAREIRRLFPSKSITELAEHFSVSRRAIRYVVDGVTWTT